MSEIGLLKYVVWAFGKFDEDTRKRCLWWLCERYLRNT